jgi:hypothetical protein
VAKFQHVKDRAFDRNDHVWVERGQSGLYICVSCGAVTDSPPPYPTPDSWMPSHYTRLEDFARALDLVCRSKPSRPHAA